MENHMKLAFLSRSVNESFARVAVAAFAAQMDPKLEEIADIKTAVSEAVTNAIIHGYENSEGEVFINTYIDGDVITIEVVDEGVGIADIQQAKQPLFTSKPRLERSGMGFTVMETFMDELEVISKPGGGTRVVMSKKIT